MLRTRYYFDVLSASEYIHKPLAGLSVSDFIAGEAVQRAEAKGVVLPSDAQVMVSFAEGHFMVEIYTEKEEELELCMQDKPCGIFAF